MSEPRGRPFAPGNKLGRGRPKGSKNRTRSEGQDLLDQYKQKLMLTCIGHAAKGSPTHMRLCMERFWPAPRGASVPFRLPPIKTLLDLERASEKVIQAVASGKVAPAQGEALQSMLKTHAEFIDNGQVESRLKETEKQLDAEETLPVAA
jgi:hypothetical protein